MSALELHRRAILELFVRQLSGELPKQALKLSNLV